MRQAFLEKYPKSRDHLGDLPTRVHFGKVADLQRQDKLDAPKTNLPIYQNLIRLGMPAGELDLYYDTVTWDWPYYTNYVEGEIYLPERLSESIQSADATGRFNALRILGFHLIRDSLSILAHKVNPTEIREWSFFPRLQMRSTVDALFEAMEAKMGKILKDSKARRRFRESKTEIMQYLGEEAVREDRAHYVDCGAQIFMYHHPARSLTEAEFELGKGFNEGTIAVLLEPVQRIYIASLAEDMGIGKIAGNDDMTNKESFQRIKKRVQEIHDILGLLDIQDLFDAFIYSRIHRLFLESDDTRLNPFVYPQLSN